MDGTRSENASLFVGGLKPSVKRTDIVAHFAKYGEVKNVNMGKLPSGICNRGFAFVKFHSSQTVELVLAEKQFIMGREVECRLSYGKKYNQVDMEINSKRKLYVSDLSAEDKNEDLENYFSRFGKIDQAYIIFYPNTNISKCFGYVEFKKECSATKARNFSHKTWKVSNFKSYKELKDNKQDLSDSNSKKDNQKLELSTSDSNSSLSTNNLSKNITAKKKGAIYSKIVEEQQNFYSKNSLEMDLQQAPNLVTEQYNYYPNNYQNNFYQDQQQFDYYNQNNYQYYGYEQVDPNYNCGYEQYPNQYYDCQNLPCEYNSQNDYYNNQYYQQNGQVVDNNCVNYNDYYNNQNYIYNSYQNMANLQESNITQC